MIDAVITTERARFEALTQEAAKEILAKMEGQQPAMRSCWYCNSSHEHLQNAVQPIMCFACGGWYLAGFPAPVVAIRARNEAITDTVMQHVVSYTTEHD